MSYSLQLGRPQPFNSIIPAIPNETNVTYNYYPILRRVLGEGSLYNLNGLSGEASIKILDDAQAQLKGKPLVDSSALTEGNVKFALQKLLVMAKNRKKSIWKVA